MILRRIAEAIRQRNWFTVLFEIMIVVLGVLLGLQVNNWNEARAERERSEQYVSRIRADLVADMTELQRHREFWGQVTEEGYAAIQYAETGDMNGATAWATLRSFLHASQAWQFTFGDADAAFEFVLDSAARGELSDKAAASVRAMPRPVSLTKFKAWMIASGSGSPRALACLGESERVIELSQSVWKSPTRTFTALFGVPSDALYRDPRWKAQVRKDGVLDLWRARGFPSQCKPVVDDDFGCVSSQ